MRARGRRFEKRRSRRLPSPHARARRQSLGLLDLHRPRGLWRADGAPHGRGLPPQGVQHQVPEAVDTAASGAGAPALAEEPGLGPRRESEQMTDAVDWGVAERVAARIGGREPFADSYHYDSLQPDFEELTAEAE